MITNFAANKILDYNFGSASYSIPSTWYIGLSTTTINQDGLGATEPVGAGYLRVGVANNKVTGFSVASLSKLYNLQQIAFPESTASWGTITYVFLSDAQTGGNIWFFEALNPSRQVGAQTQVIFPASRLEINFTNT